MPVGPRQGGSQQHLQQQTCFQPLLDTFCLGFGCAFCIISAGPYLADHCRGQRTGAAFSDHHPSAPGYASESVLLLYPCDGSARDRAFFLAQHWPRILKDLLSFRAPELWLAAFLSFWLLLLASRICLTSRMYTQLAAPYLTLAARASPLVLFLAAGPKSSLSSAASQFLFRGQGFLDAIVSITQQPNCCAPAEVLFGAFSVAAVGILAAWHGGNGDEGPSRAGGSDGGGAAAARVFVAQVVLQRAALLVAVHWLVRRFPYRRQRGRGISGGGGQALVVPASPPQHQQRQQPELLSQQQHSQQQQQPQSQHSRLPAVPEAPSEAAAADVKLQRTAAEEGCAPPSPVDCNGQHVNGGYKKMELQAAASATAAAAAAETGADSHAAADATALAAASAMAAAAAADLGAHYGAALRAGPGIPYRSPIRRRTARIKIPFAEPDQISPGYVERLRELVKERGMVLSGVYVRQGCIELLLDLEADPDAILYGDLGLALGPAGPQDRPQQRTSPASGSAANGGGGGGGGGGLDGGSGIDVDGVLRALGIAAPEPMDARKAAVGVTVVQLGRDEQLGSSYGGGAERLPPPPPSRSLPPWPRPRLLELSPRVLLTPPSESPPRPDAVASDGGAGHDGVRPAVARLSAVVSYPATNAGAAAADAHAHAATPVTGTVPPLPEVLVRCQGAYLPARLALREQPDGGGGSSSGGGDVTVSYDLELLDLPATPGTVLVELRWCDALSLAVPILVVHDPAVAAELQSASAAAHKRSAAATATAAAAAAAAAAAGGDMFDDLLLDFGAWLADAAAAATATSPSPYMPYHTFEALAAHLRRHALACGWAATAHRIQTDMERITRKANRLEGTTVTEPGVAAAAACGGGIEPVPAAVAAPAAAAAAPCGVSGAARPAARSPLLSALLQALGWSVLPPKEEAAYQDYAAPRVLSYCHVMQAVEVMSLLALLFRARQQLLDPGNLTSLAGCAVGTCTAMAWPFMPRRRWEGLVTAAKVGEGVGG
ncbi:hypothetical protein PLESTB_000883600 [Pleodorina starrii]|uniref:Uncharacterized protein n=1 Tax=Pleodorina starrii TaxID=330485 RepID=A0A9W6F323_9CHLO|nr:hypothetical protein PLESTB_000883600 [Pleodorina starrii]